MHELGPVDVEDDREVVRVETQRLEFLQVTELLRKRADLVLVGVDGAQFQTVGERIDGGELVVGDLDGLELRET